MYVTRLAFSLLVCVTLAAFALIDCAEAEGSSQTDQSSYRLQSSVMGAAGATVGSGAHQSRSTMGQSTPIGIGSTPDMYLYAGFWMMRGQESAVPGDGDPRGVRNALFQSFPNPFLTTTTIAYSVARNERVRITVFNALGQQVRCLIDETSSPGIRQVVWDGRDSRGALVSPGIYLYSMRIAGYEAVKKAVVIR